MACPFGSLVFGPLGDKIGRSGVLITTVLMMSVGTALVGVLPTSELLSFGIVVGMLILITLLGWLSDKLGHKPLLYVARGGLIVISIPAFYLMSLGRLWLAFAGLALIAFFVVFLSGGSTFVFLEVREREAVR